MCFDKAKEGEQALTHSRDSREDQRTDASALDLSIVIVSFNTRELTRRSLKSIEEYASGISHEVFLVDNASSDGSANMVAEAFPWVHLIRMKENRGFAGGNIPGMERAKGRYVVLLNSDAFLADGVLAKTISHMEKNPEIGVLGCKLTNPDGSLQPSARMLPGPLNKVLHITGLAARFPGSKFFGRVDFSWCDHSEPQSVGWVVGAFFMIRRKTMEEIGFLDDRYFLYFEEIDYCLTARRAGWDVVFYPHAQVVHLGGQSALKTRQKVSAKGRQMISIRLTSEFRYYRKCYGLFHVMVSASIELLWEVVVFTKNSFGTSADAAGKKEEARALMGLIVKTLLEDRWGKGKERI